MKNKTSFFRGLQKMTWIPKFIRPFTFAEVMSDNSFYGVCTIGVMHLIIGAGFTDVEAASTMSFYRGIYYLTPIITMYAIFFIPRHSLILFGAVGTSIGHLMLAFVDAHIWLHMALSMTFLGSGMIKPLPLSIIGDKCGPNKDILSKAVVLSYWIHNLCLLALNVFLPELYMKYGKLAFAVSLIFTVGIILVITLNKKHCHTVKIERKRGKSFARISTSAMLAKIRNHNWHDVVSIKYGTEELQDFRKMLTMISFFILTSLYYAGYEQMYVSFFIHSSKMECNVMGYTMLPAQMQAINAICVILLTPMMRKYVVKLLESKKIVSSSIEKFAVAMWLLVGVFGYLVITELLLSHGIKINIILDIALYMAMGVVEIFGYNYGIECALTYCPSNKKALSNSMFFVTGFCGSMITVLIAKFNYTIGVTYFACFFILSVCSLFLLKYVLRQFKKEHYVIKI
jgi:POT family proton-dependent oligopeptide transporter